MCVIWLYVTYVCICVVERAFMPVLLSYCLNIFHLVGSTLPILLLFVGGGISRYSYLISFTSRGRGGTTLAFF
jgi:hypothetical protein